MQKYILLGCLINLFSHCVGQTGQNAPITDSLHKRKIENLPKDSAAWTLNASESELDSMMMGWAPMPANWQTFGTFESTIAFSKIAPLGKMSVFIVSTAWCAPCKSLKHELLKINKKYEKTVQFYYVNMSEGHSYDDLKKTDAYFFARMYDRLKEWPRVTITSPSGSILKTFSQEDLITECQKNTLFEQYQVAAKTNQPLVLTTLEKAIDTCTKVSVLDKVTEILDRFLPHQAKFNTRNVIIQVPQASKKG